MANLNMHDMYPVVDWVPDNFDRQVYKAKWTGEKRAPKKGEWFLSGSIIEAYRAPEDQITEHYIARIFRVRKVEYWEEIK